LAIEKHFIQEGIIRSQVEEFLSRKIDKAGYSRIEIKKVPLSTQILLFVERPPLIIGKRGKKIERMTSELKNRFNIEKPMIDVQKVTQPNLDANLVAKSIATALERGMNRRRVIYRTLRAVMHSGARGVEISLSGKIVGKGGRSRTEKYLEGYMKKAGDSLKLVDMGLTQAYLKAGIIGVTVRIVKPDVVFPDHIDVLKGIVIKEETPGDNDANLEKKLPEDSDGKEVKK